MSFVSKELLGAILDRYELPRRGIHGLSHWARVMETGRKLLKKTGARPDVVDLFAVLHDSKRVNEGVDDDHGIRAAEFASALRGSFFEIDDDGFDLLHRACRFHTNGRTDGDITILTCWDADRLDLARVGIIPAPERLCTPAGRDPDTIRAAVKKSEEGYLPALLLGEWGIDYREE